MKLQRQHKCTSSWQLWRCQCSASVSWHAPSAPAATDLCFSARARLASARAPRDAARFPAHCLEDACCLVTLESGVLAVVAKGRLTLESGVLAVVAKGRLAPWCTCRPRCATFAPQRLWHNVTAIVAQCHIRGGRPTPELSGVVSSPTAEWGSCRMSAKAAGLRNTKQSGTA